MSAEPLTTWFVTGAQGFIGRYLTAAILTSFPADRAVGVGRSPCLPHSFSHSISGPNGSAAAPLPPDVRIALESSRYCYLPADLLDYERIAALLDRFRPRVIIHLASGLRDDARKTLFAINFEGTGALLEAAASVKNYAPTVVLGSTGGVYGRVPAHELPLSEDRACHPIDEYCISKLAAELLAELLADRFEFDLRIARIFNVIGPGQEERHAAGYMAAELQRVKTGQQTKLRLGPLHTTRDFVDVRDVASALVALAEEKVGRGVFNVGSGRETPMESLLAEFLQVSGMSPEIEQKEARAADIPRHFADVDRVAQLGFRPGITLAASVRAVWDYYEELWTVPDSKLSRLRACLL